MSNTGNVSLGKMTNSGRVTSKVGQLLQEARRQRGLEIKDIAASTHVRSEYLAALEEGRFSELPENVYTRNFLRLYAEAVGLDEQEVLEHYSLERYGKSDAPRKSIYPSPAYDTSTESFVAGSTETEEDARKKRRGIGWLVPLLILGVLSLGSYYAWRNYVFPNDETGGYTLNLFDREINLPNFGRSVATDNGIQAGTDGVEGTTTDISSTNATDSSEEASSTTDVTLPSTDTSSGEGTEASTSGADATSATGEEGATTTDDASTATSDSGENAADGVLITPSSTISSDDSSATATDDVEGVDSASASAATAAGAEGSEATGDFVLFSIATEPAGAEVNIDNFYLGTTPITGFPVTPSADKQLSISLDGYQTLEQSFDGTEEQDFFFALEASTPTGDITDVEGDATNVDSITINSDGTVIATDDPSFTPAAELRGKAVITIEDGGEAWLEVYQGTSRSGDQLVYRVANDSDRFEFDMPVFIRAGRSSLVQVSVNGGLAKPLGPPDEVAEQLFDE